MGDANIIYKERSLYSMVRLVNRTFPVCAPHGESGMLAWLRCANTTRSCGLSAGDVVLNTGQGVSSIANGLVRKLHFNNITQHKLQASL